MALKFGKKKRRQNNVFYTIITAILLCVAFLSMVSSFYTKAEEEAYEMLHIQTKQIKDDLILQIKSDHENLITMANFASNLYARGEDYSLMFDSFKPIGLYARIGILTPDGMFTTKDGRIDLSERLPFEEAILHGNHITGRTYSYSNPDEEVIRTGVPVQANGKTVAMIYGVIKIETINAKYNNMAEELDAQLFVYDKETGKFIIDTIENPPGELSQFKTREYNKGYSYDQLISTDNGFTSFKSIFTGEDLYVHYSTIEDFDWGIMLARYESQVFAGAHETSSMLLATFIIILFIISGYSLIILASERTRADTSSKASEIRKLLLDINQQSRNICEALKNVQDFSESRSAFFADTDGEEFDYILPKFKNRILKDEEKKYLVGELFHYAASLYNAKKLSIGAMRIVPNAHLIKTNPELYKFLTEHKIKAVSFAAVTDKNNHVSILGVLNPEVNRASIALLEDIAVCFSIAVFNKNHLNKTELAATTDSLTGVMNRVSYKKDILALDEEKPKDFSCIYIDVNELHLRNNKYGHAAGDEMLIYIANTLKEVFFGHKIYRMGGDEFLVFTKDVSLETVKACLNSLMEQLKIKDYHVAIGMSYRTQNTNCEEMVREAEIRMYEAKAQYYQNKENSSVAKDKDNKYSQIKTGIMEIDTMISVLKEHYNGIYRVSLDKDTARRILMPSYLGYNENEEHFSRLLAKYIDEIVHPDFHRPVMSFLNYDAIKRHIAEGNTPTITYKKANGEQVILTVYKLDEHDDVPTDTLWVFAKD